MNNLKKIYYRLTDNPLLGVVPLVVFVSVNYITSYSTSLLAGFLTTFLCSLFVVSVGGKGKIYSGMFLGVSVTTLSINTILYFFPIFDNLLYSYYSPLVTEITFVIVLSLTVLFKKQIQLFFINITKSQITSLILDSIDEYVHVSKIILYVFIAHLTVTGIYFLLPFIQTDVMDGILIWAFAPIFVFLMLFFEYIRLSYLQKKLNSEEWVAIVDEKGKVIGKIAKSETSKHGNKYLHPVVRIAVTCKGRLFLIPRMENMLLDPGKIDHPFEKYVKYGHTLDEAAINLVKDKECKIPDIKPRFSIKYLFENDKTRRLIFLYTIDACDEECIQSQEEFKTGKFWTQKQIEENLNAEVFSECFEMEYDYLKNTILLFSSFDTENENQGNSERQII